MAFHRKVIVHCHAKNPNPNSNPNSKPNVNITLTLTVTLHIIHSSVKRIIGVSEDPQFSKLAAQMSATNYNREQTIACRSANFGTHMHIAKVSSPTNFRPNCQRP